MARLKLVIGAAITALVFATAIAGEVLPLDDAIHTNFAGRLAPPSAAHWLGADELGRDLMSRLVVGAKSTVAVAFAAIVGAYCVGTPIGLAARNSASWLRRPVIIIAHLFYVAPAYLLAPSWLSRVAVALCCGLLILPGALLALSAIAIWGPGSATTVIALAIFFASAVSYAVVYAPPSGGDSAGVAEGRARNLVSTPAVLATSLFAWAVLAKSAIDAIGLGIAPPLPSWGSLAVGMHAVTRPIAAAASGLCLLLTVFGAFLLGDGLRRRGIR